MVARSSFYIERPHARFSVYSHLPYSPRGSQVVQTATWRDENYKTVNKSSVSFFPEKFSK